MAILASQEYIDNITTCLSILAKKVSMCGRLNLTDTHVMSEDFYAGLLNIARGWHLKNANTEHSNAAGIDLVDDNARFLVQVSATCTKKKIEDSLKGIDSAFKGYHFYFLPIITGTAKSQKKLRFIPPHEVVFDPQEDIIEMEDLIQAMKSDVSGQRLKEADSYIRSNLRISFSDKDKAPSTPSYADLKDHLMKELERVRKSHPSFRLMKIDENLFPDGIPELHNLEAKNDAGERKPVMELVADSWRKGEKNHLMIEGEGGIGKTVTLLSLPDRIAPRKVPAVYVQLHELKGVKEEETIEEYIRQKYFLDKDALFRQFTTLSNEAWKEGPRVLLLLDGFNEIAPDRRFTIGRDIHRWSERQGVQIVTSSRFDIHTYVPLGEGYSRIDLQPLGREVIEDYLVRSEVPLPDDQKLWSVISFPLMLILYVGTKRVNSDSLQAFREDDNSAGAIIWNYLQREIWRYRDKEANVVKCVLAAEFIAPYVAWKMQQDNRFYLDSRTFREYVRQGCEKAAGLEEEQFPKHLSDVLAEVEVKLAGEVEVKLPGEKEMRRFLKEELRLFVRRGDSYSLMHQQFRDALAAMHLINVSYASSDLPEEWKVSIDPYVLDFVAELSSLEEADRLWEQNWRWKPQDDTATVNMLGLQGRKRNNDFSGLDFSGMNLKDISLYPYRHPYGEPRTRRLLLPQAREHNKDLAIVEETFYPEGHRNRVSALAITPDGRRCVSGSRDHTLRVWDLISGKCLHILKGHGHSVSCLALTPDGRRCVSGSWDRTLRVWDLEKGVCLHTLKGHENDINCLSLTPDGRRCVSGSRDKTLRVWDLESEKCLHILKGHDDWIMCLSLTPDGRRCISGSWDHTLRVWDIDKGERLHTLTRHEAPIYCLAITPDGLCCVSGSYDKTLCVWDLEKGVCLHTLKGHKDTISCLSITPDGRFCVSGAVDRTIHVWDIKKGKHLRILKGHKRVITCLYITLNSRCCVSGSWDHTLRVWDLEKGKCLHILKGHERGIQCLSLSSDDRHFVSGSWDHTLRVWDLSSGACLKILEGREDPIECLSLTLDGRCCISGSWDHTLRVWDLSNWVCLKILEGHEGPIYCLSITRDGRYCVSGSWDNTLRVWDLGKGKWLHTLKGHKGSIECLSLTPEGRYCVSGSRDHTLRVWDLEKGKRLHTLKGHEGSIECLSLTPDGRYCVSGSRDHTLRVWDLSDGKCLHSFKGHEGLIECLAITPEGRRCVSGSTDGTLHVWDFKNEKCCPLEGHTDAITCLGITPDGSRCVSGSRDNTLRVWNLERGKLLHTLKGHGGLVRHLSITPDGLRCVSGSRDKTLRVWDLESEKCCTLEGSEGEIWSLALSPDGRCCVTGTSEGFIQEWRIEGEPGLVNSIRVLPLFLEGIDFSASNVPEDLKQALRQNGAIV